MKESDITPEVIAKAKEIAKYWRMEIKGGHWYKRDNDIFLLGKGDSIIDKRGVIPIPSISDVLARFNGLDYVLYRCYEHEQAIDVYDLPSMWEIVVKKRWGIDKSSERNVKASSLHLALLSALLEVLTKGKEK